MAAAPPSGPPLSRSYQPIYLESQSPVITWEHDGIRCFVAEEGLLIRQGETQVAAPAAVVWFDRAQSENAEVGRALVRVYAQARLDDQGNPLQRVRIVSGEEVLPCTAAYLHFESRVSFVWDCPLVRSSEEVPSVLLSRAQAATAGLDEDTVWRRPPDLQVQAPTRMLRQSLQADHSQVFLQGTERGVAVYMGDVHGTYNNMELRADAAVQWYDMRTQVAEVYARGNVRLFRRPDFETDPLAPEAEWTMFTDFVHSLKADEIYINPTRRRGATGDFEVRMSDPLAPEGTVYAFRGKRAFMLDSQTLALREVDASTCDFARPHYRFTADRMQVVRQGESTMLTAWDVAFKVGDDSPTTVLKLPFLGTDLTQRAYLLTDYAVGSTSKFGVFMQTTWRPLDVTTPPAWVDDWTVQLDYYSKRGPAVGTEFAYSFGGPGYPRHSGEFFGYYVNDHADEDDTGLPVPQTNRGKAHWRHRTFASPEWRVDAEYYYLSDEGFLNEYFEDEFEDEKTPESYLLARYLKDSTYLALLFKQQVNDFLTQLEHEPSADLEIIGLPLGRLVYEGTIQAGGYDLEFSDLITPAPADPPSVTRAHTDHKLSLPFRIGIVRLDPFVRALATYASDSAMMGGTFGGSESRSGFGAGFTASTTFSRSFDVVSEAFDLNRLRHIVIPYVGFEALSVSGADPADFIQMDAVDTIDTGSQGTFGLRQRLQTKRMVDGRWQTVNWGRLDTELVMRSSDSVDPALDSDFLRADMELLLTEHIAVHSMDNVFGLDGQPDLINAGLTVDFLPDWALSVDYDFITDFASAVTVELNTRLSDRYRLLVRQQYEFDSRGTGKDTNLESRVVVRRILHEWLLDIGVSYEKANDEFAVIFGFGPKGWGFFSDRRRPIRRGRRSVTGAR